MTIPDDGRRPARGIVPTLIQWDVPAHPAERLPPSNVSIVELAASHPDPGPVRAALAALGLAAALRVELRPRDAAVRDAAHAARPGDALACALRKPARRARDRPQAFDAAAAHADDPVVEVDRRVAVARNEPHAIAGSGGSPPAATASTPCSSDAFTYSRPRAPYTSGGPESNANAFSPASTIARSRAGTLITAASDVQALLEVMLVGRQRVAVVVGVHEDVGARLDFRVDAAVALVLPRAGARAGDGRGMRCRPPRSSPSCRARERDGARDRRAGAPRASAGAARHRGRRAARETRARACARSPARSPRPAARARRRSDARRRRSRPARRASRPAARRRGAQMQHARRVVGQHADRRVRASAREARQLRAPTISLVTSTSRMPAATKAAASSTFWQQMPTAPRSTCSCAIVRALVRFRVRAQRDAGAARRIRPSGRGCARTDRGRRPAPACRCPRRSRRREREGFASAPSNRVAAQDGAEADALRDEAASRSRYFGPAASSAASWP